MNPFDYLLPPLFSTDELFAAQYAYDIADYVAAFEIWERLATLGNGEALFNVGYCYLSGKGVVEDHQKALRFFSLAGDQKHLDAIVNIGLIYEFGQGVAQDYSKACNYFRRAADAGSSKAQAYLGNMYKKGLGVPRDYRQTVHLYEQAIHAHPPSYMAFQNLANCYVEGTGVPINHGLAQTYFDLARRQVQPTFLEQILISRRFKKGKTLYAKRKAGTSLAQHSDAEVEMTLRRALNDLKSVNSSDRVNAVAVLRELDAPCTIDNLIETIDDSDSHVRFHVCLALGRKKDGRAVNCLIKALLDSDPGIRWRAAEALGEIGDNRAVNGLVNALHDPAPSVRRDVAFSLGKIRHESAIDPLIATLGDPEYEVQRAVVWALLQFGTLDSKKVDSVASQSTGKVHDLAIEIVRGLARTK